MGYMDDETDTGGRKTGLEYPVFYVPEDTPVRLRMLSRDVIHSFWIPEFRTKMDVIPNRYTGYGFHTPKLREGETMMFPWRFFFSPRPPVLLRRAPVQVDPVDIRGDHQQIGFELLCGVGWLTAASWRQSWQRRPTWHQRLHFLGTGSCSPSSDWSPGRSC